MQKWIFSLPLHPSSPIFYDANPFQNQTLKEEEGVGARDVGNPEKKGESESVLRMTVIWFIRWFL